VLKKNVTTIVFAVLWLLLVTGLLCTPGTKFPKITWQDKIWFDKWVHIFLFMVLVILWSRAYTYKKNIRSDSRKIFFQIMMLGIFYGIAMEIVQKYFIPFRSFDLLDIIADGIGCVAGYFFAIKKFYPR
jgi:VanZ family protein